MVENVIDNAVKHNEPAGWIRVGTEIEGPLARLVVDNGGPLLGQDDVSQLAQPFRRLGDLPGLHGDTLCRMIADGDSPVMVLMLTASGSPGERVSGLSLGADDYLAKPFHFPELVLRVRALARRQPAARARVFRAAGLELDALRHTAARDGRRLDLSAREFGVLEALMRAQHAVLSAEDLLEQVWDEHADPFSNVVSVTISRLRRKLGDPPVIETIPNVGYQIMTG
jgi:DNA-binding response OmpR family regulator